MDHRPICKMQNYNPLEDNIGVSPDKLGYSKDILDITPKAWFMKEIIDKLDFIKIKNFCSTNDTVKRMRRQVRG